MKVTVGRHLKQGIKSPLSYSYFLSKPYSKHITGTLLLSLLQSCNHISHVSQVHGHMVKTGLDRTHFNLSKLLASSIKDMSYAASIFRSIQNPDLFMFNTMLRCYSISERPQRGFGLFNYLRATGVLLDQFSFITTIKSCAGALAIEMGSSIHAAVIRAGFDSFLNVRNALMHFYCACWEVSDAHQLFDEFSEQNDLVSWNTLMGGYLNVSIPDMVVDLFRMLVRSSLSSNAGTVVNVLSAFGEMENHYGGETLHGSCIKIGISFDMNVATALISMYGNVRDVVSGCRVFDEILKTDVIMWNCLIDAHSKNGYLNESLSLLKLMKLEGLKPNSSTVAGLLSACAGCEAGSIGQCVANFVEQEQLALDAVLSTALLAMYSKCGFLEKAIDIFNRTEDRDTKTWTAMISAYGAHGHPKTAVACLRDMEEEGCWPNEVTFLAALSACSHGGLVEEGMNCIESMVRVYCMEPRVEHYGCLIDLLGRAGLLGQALGFINGFPFEVDATVWRTLLAACRVHGNVELGEQVKRVLVERYGDHPTDSILLSSAYAMVGRLVYDPRTRDRNGQLTAVEERVVAVITKTENIVKEIGCSSFEVTGDGLSSH
ncbi:hypothetical protein Dimus_016536 [Dionaea muscipula]